MIERKPNKDCTAWAELRANMSKNYRGKVYTNDSGETYRYEALTNCREGEVQARDGQNRRVIFTLKAWFDLLPIRPVGSLIRKHNPIEASKTLYFKIDPL